MKLDSDDKILWSTFLAHDADEIVVALDASFFVHHAAKRNLSTLPPLLDSWLGTMH